jgi:tRNA-dependent cyclodipeptide synthase
MLAIKDFLDTHQVKYTITSYSSAYGTEEVEKGRAMLGMELVEAVLLEIDGGKVSMAVFPKSMMIDLVSLKEKLGAKTIKILTSEDLKKILPNHSSDIINPVGKFYGVEVLMAGELANITEVKFLGDSPKDMLSMACADLLRLSYTRTDIRIATKSKYHVLIDNISPEIERHRIKNYDDCFLGISLENPSFSTAKLIAITDWIANRFRTCKVLVGDSLHRLTLQINRRLTERQALTQALFLGKEYINTKLSVFDRRLDTCAFEFIYCSDIQRSDNYREYYKVFEDLLQKSRKFSASVNLFSLKFVSRHLKVNQDFIPDNNFRDICQKYLLEELAIFSCLFEAHLCPILYPGSLSIFEEIANGEHPDVPDCLKNMIYVSLQFKKR